MTLQDEEESIDVEIVKLLTSILPTHWRSALLEIEFTLELDDTESFVHRIKSPEGHRDFITPPDEMYISTFQLYDLFLKAGYPWHRVKYLVEESIEGDWEYLVTFEYPEKKSSNRSTE